MATNTRILSGMRPTGALHLGNLHGALAQWVKLQAERECFFFIADWHALTTNYENPGDLSELSRQMVIDWLSAGISPEKSTLFVQSQIAEHAELFLILAMVTPLPWLERNPTYKDQMQQFSGAKDLAMLGFLGYPVLQAADIIMYKTGQVPVGEDQVPHVEITREIARRFNHIYGRVFPEPQPLLTPTPRILGLDRRKMSKSYDNAIYLGDSPAEITQKTGRMITDPQRARKTDPGDPEVCNVYDFHRLYTEAETVAEIYAGCRAATFGCMDCKKKLAANLAAYLAPIREKRAYYLEKPGQVDEIMAAGTRAARQVAQATMAEVRAAINI